MRRLAPLTLHCGFVDEMPEWVSFSFLYQIRGRKLWFVPHGWVYFLSPVFSMLLLLSATIINYFTDLWSSANSSISDRHEGNNRVVPQRRCEESLGGNVRCVSQAEMIHSFTDMISLSFLYIIRLEQRFLPPLCLQLPAYWRVVPTSTAPRRTPLYQEQ